MAQVVSPTDVVRGVFAALDAKDPAAVTAQMTDDVRMRLGNAELVEGKAEFRKATTSFVASIAAIRHEITSMWSFDDVVIAEMEVHYERLDGTKVTLPFCNVFRVRDGTNSSQLGMVARAPWGAAWCPTTASTSTSGRCTHEAMRWCSLARRATWRTSRSFRHSRLS